MSSTSWLVSGRARRARSACSARSCVSGVPAGSRARRPWKSMRLAWTTRAVSNTDTFQALDRAAVAPVVVDERPCSLDVALAEVPEGRTEILDGRGRAGVLPVDDGQPAVAQEHVLGAHVEVANPRWRVVRSRPVGQFVDEPGDDWRPPGARSVLDEPSQSSRVIVSQYHGSGVPSVDGACTCIRASDAATSSSTSRSPTGIGSHVQPFVDAHVPEQPVAVDRASGTGQVHAGVQHQLLQLDVGVGLLDRRHEQLDLLDGPDPRRGGEPADATELPSCHVRRWSHRRAETEHLADLGDVHAPSLPDGSQERDALGTTRRTLVVRARAGEPA